MELSTITVHRKNILEHKVPPSSPVYHLQKLSSQLIPDIIFKGPPQNVLRGHLKMCFFGFFRAKMTKISIQNPKLFVSIDLFQNNFPQLLLSLNQSWVKMGFYEGVGGFKSQFQRPLMVGLIDIKYFYLQVKMSKMIPESYNQFAAPLGHGSLILKIVKEIFSFFSY